MKDNMRTDALLFGESQSRIIVSIKNQNLENLLNLAQKRNVIATVIGETGGENLIICHLDKEIINISVTEMYKLWKETIPKVFKIK